LNRKTIVTNMAVVACDVCGRTLLRGENADVFLHGGSRRTVCELCTSRAMHEGWIREGLDDGLARRGSERNPARSLLGRLRSRRTERADERPAAAPPVAYDPASYDPDQYAPVAGFPGEDPDHAVLVDPEPAPAPVQRPAPVPAQVAPPAQTTPPLEEMPRERGISAVPTNVERKIARALEVFNVGVHTRTVSGVARSLGKPIVSARPSATEGSVVTIVVAWELSWYRYEVDLGDEASGVRVTGQGTELSELPEEDRTPNARADEGGFLHPSSDVA
jgi:hypothetical protein